MSKWPLNDPGVYIMYGHCDGDIEAIVTTDGRLLVEQDGGQFADLTSTYTLGSTLWQFRQGKKQHILLKDVQLTVNGADEAADRSEWQSLLRGPAGNLPSDDVLAAYTQFSVEESGETMTTSSTGGRKAVKRARFDLLPARALWEVAEHFGSGAEKYGDSNWEKGIEWSKFFQAMQRHAWLFWSGEDYDPGMNSKHLAAVVFHALVLMESMEIHPEFDDRLTHE